MTVNLYDLYTQLRDEGIIFCFSGPVSQSTVEGIGDTLLQKMEREELSMNISRKVFSVFVEQMQNVVNHSAEKVDGAANQEGELRYGVVVVGRENDKFYVLSGNYIESSEVESLERELALIRSMNKEELKAYFKEKRRQDPLTEDKGAGLGFIETARKATEPIDYTVIPVDKKRAFFSIKALI